MNWKEGTRTPKIDVLNSMLGGFLRLTRFWLFINDNENILILARFSSLRSLFREIVFIFFFCRLRASRQKRRHTLDGILRSFSKTNFQSPRQCRDSRLSVLRCFVLKSIDLFFKIIVIFLNYFLCKINFTLNSF